MEEEKDKLTQLIAERLGERKNKLDKMDAWEKQKKGKTIMPQVIMALAACLLLGFIVKGLIPHNDNLEDAVRGADIDVKELVDAKLYDEALRKVDSVLQISDQTIKELEQQKADEEQAYELEAEKQKNDAYKAMRKEIIKKIEK